MTAEKEYKDNDHGDRKQNGDDDRQIKYVDYARRKRSAEWRSQWFRIGRSDDDRELAGTFRRAYERKAGMIKEQISIADHLAAYAPAGAGTPWFSIGPNSDESGGRNA